MSPVWYAWGFFAFYFVGLAFGAAEWADANQERLEAICAAYLKAEP